MYKHIISLGFFCGPALELEKIGIRDNSYPFDWLISGIEGVVECLEGGFDGLLEYENLSQYKEHKNFYVDEKYGFHFYHDFTEYLDLKSQLPAVKEKYARRIKRFLCDIQNPTLFIRYMENQDEINYIMANYDRLIELLKEKNRYNDLVLIANDDIDAGELNVYMVEKDKDDSVARNFLDKNFELSQYLCSDIYDISKRSSNLDYYREKQNKRRISKLPYRIIAKIKKTFKKTYVHDKIWKSNVS